MLYTKAEEIEDPLKSGSFSPHEISSRISRELEGDGSLFAVMKEINFNY
jgi:hypothetical protein